MFYEDRGEQNSKRILQELNWWTNLDEYYKLKVKNKEIQKRMR